MRMTRRIRVLVLTFDELAFLLTQKHGLLRMDCLPDDAQIVQVESRCDLGQATLFVQSETFAECPLNVVPEWLRLAFSIEAPDIFGEMPESERDAIFGLTPSIDPIEALRLPAELLGLDECGSTLDGKMPDNLRECGANSSSRMSFNIADCRPTKPQARPHG